MENLTCFLNNSFIPLAEAAIPVNDLGLQRGYGIFDFMRVTKNVPLFQEDHLDRFYNSAAVMRLPVKQNKEELKAIIKQLIQKNALPDSGIKLLLTGGASPDGYQPGTPNLLITQQFISPPPDTILSPGYKLVTFPHQRQLPEIKTTDYLIAIHLQPWMKVNGADDILYHQNGTVSECPRSNFFIVTQNKTLVTAGKNILKGITRKQILTVAANIGIQVEERDISLEDIQQASEVFISSSTKRLIPVIQVDDTGLPPFSADSVTAKLFNAFKEWELSAIHNYQ